MSTQIKTLSLIVLVLFPLGLSAAAPVTRPEAGWSQKMRDLGSVLNQLLVDISSDERFENKKNFKAIEKNAIRFASLAHGIKSKSDAPPDKDMSLQLIGSDFSAEADYAVKSLKAGHRAYARVILGSMSNYCIACHTRTGTGPQLAGIKLDPKLESLAPVAKGNYFVAIRNFDRALSEYQKVTADQENAILEPFEYERALRAGLSVAVRVKHDPDMALNLVGNVIANPKAPFFLREQAAEWKKSLTEWKAEKPFSSEDMAKVFGEASRLIANAKEVQKFPADRSADILYLRASGVVHDLLGLSPTGLMAANALYLAGLCYDVLYDYGVKDFSEFYYRSCIRTSPHTEVSKSCYRRYEESVYLGYTGSGGTYIPSDVRGRLNELELLSAVAPVPKVDSPQLQ